MNLEEYHNKLIKDPKEVDQLFKNDNILNGYLVFFLNKIDEKTTTKETQLFKIIALKCKKNNKKNIQDVMNDNYFYEDVLKNITIKAKSDLLKYILEIFPLKPSDFNLCCTIHHSKVQDKIALKNTFEVLSEFNFDFYKVDADKGLCVINNFKRLLIANKLNHKSFEAFLEYADFHKIQKEIEKFATEIDKGKIKNDGIALKILQSAMIRHETKEIKNTLDEKTNKPIKIL